MIDVRCVNCGRLLLKENLKAGFGRIEARCKDCKTINVLADDGVNRYEGSIDNESDLIDNFSTS